MVGLIAIGVLLLVTNWFFHRVYWSEWIGRFHRQRRKLMEKEQAGFWSAQALGLVVLGLTSVYREGFETVLFLQSLELSAGATAVIEGAGLGLALTLGVAVLTFALQRKLPYKKMLIVTGVLLGVVLVVMVGQTARTMQGTGWLPITPLDWEIPSSLGLWLGVFPSVETLVAQVAAIVFVIGSYALATELKVRRPQRRAARRQVDAEPVGGARRARGVRRLGGVQRLRGRTSGCEVPRRPRMSPRSRYPPAGRRRSSPNHPGPARRRRDDTPRRMSPQPPYAWSR